jgi:hypothetical protein
MGGDVGALLFVACRHHRLQPVSSVITLQELDLASIADHSNSSSSTVSTVLQAGCSADALAVWFELQAAAGLTVSTGPSLQEATSTSRSGHTATTAAGQLLHSSEMGLGVYYLNTPLSAQPAGHKASQQAAAAAVSVTTWHSPAAVRLAFDVNFQTDGEPCTGTSQHDLGAPDTTSSRGTVAVNVCSSSRSWTAKHEHCVSSSSSSAGDIEGTPALTRSVEVAGAQQQGWSPHGFPRYAWLPRWHFDMLADAARNDAYEAALR